MAAPIRLEFAPPVARITLDRPPHNVLDIATIEQLSSTIATIAPRPDLSVITLESAVDGAFSAGVDVADHVPDRVRKMLATFHSVFRQLDAIDAVTIAAVDGHCLGGGCELAMACDFILATKRSRFGQPEIDVGCFPPVACALLGRRVTPRLALEMILTGAPITAAEAKSAGLVSRICASLPEDVKALVESLARKSVPVVRAAKRAFRQAMEEPFLDGLAAAEETYLVDLLPLEDLAEGVKAFLEKRPPQWRNR